MSTDDPRARRVHWDERYATTTSTDVSWYQPVPTVSLRLINALGLPSSSALVDVGAGASTLVDTLIGRGWTDLTVLDVSAEALAVARARVSEAAATWIATDLLTWQPDRRYDIWHDRAVFHFLTDDEDRAAYRDVLTTALAPSGAVVVGTFALDGPTHCSGLPVERYDADGLAAALGPGLDVVSSEREEHHTPSGASQPFMWVVLRRRGTPAQLP